MNPTARAHPGGDDAIVHEFSAEDVRIDSLGEGAFPTPLASEIFVDDREGVAVSNLRSSFESGSELAFFELAGPRRQLFHDPAALTAGIVTCGGLCPGLNDVVRGITLQLVGYGVGRILGFRYGYRGLSVESEDEPLTLTAESVSEIHRRGGTVLKSSRHRREPREMLDALEKWGVGILFVIGGDGTMRGATAITDEIARRGLRMGIIGVPKTIDNDIAVIDRTFGFETAVAEAVRAIYCGHVEAHDAPNGVALIKLMGRDAGFIAAAASVASGEANLCLVPEVPFALGGERGILRWLEGRLALRKHAVIVVAEGAGKALRDATCDGDVGAFLRDRIKAHFTETGGELNLKYIDPSYMIRSVPASADDSVFCARLGHHAVHAGMAGRTGMLVGHHGDQFIHVPFRLLAGKTKQIDPHGRLWDAVLASTNQPRELV